MRPECRNVCRNWVCGERGCIRAQDIAPLQVDKPHPKIAYAYALTSMEGRLSEVQLERRLMSWASVARLSQMRPGERYRPTRMHPEVSATVLPAWMRMPAKQGTLKSWGSVRLKRGE